MAEKLLTENPNRYVLFPIEDKDIWDAYKKQEASIWHVHEVDLSGDLQDWHEKLNDNERYFIKNVLGFFAASDGIVGENLAENFYSEVQLPEARCFYGFQIMMENIHSEMYSLLLETYVNDNKEKQRLFNSIDTIPCIRQKAEWAFKWMRKNEYSELPECIKQTIITTFENCALDDPNYDNNKKAFEMVTAQSPSFAERLIAFAVVEGIFFSGSFCSIFWLKQRNLMSGLCVSNKFISRDEGLHCLFAILLYSKLSKKLDENVVHTIIKEAVIIEKQFIIESIPCDLIGMNSVMMSQYIEFVADRLSQQLGYSKIYNQTNPFPFMDMISLDYKENFFEGRVTSYRKAGVMESESNKEFDEEF